MLEEAHCAHIGAGWSSNGGLLQDLSGLILELDTATKFIGSLDTSRTQQVVSCHHGNTGKAKATLVPITGL